MPTQLKEIVVALNVFDAQHGAPDSGQDIDGRGDGAGDARWRNVRGTCRLRKRAAVQLAASGQRQPVEHHELCRNHVLGQHPSNVAAQHFDIHWRFRDQISGQFPDARAVGRCSDDTIADGRLIPQRRLYFTRLHPESTDLDLLIRAPNKFNLACFEQPS